MVARLIDRQGLARGDIHRAARASAALECADGLAGVDIEIHTRRVRENDCAVVHNRVSSTDGEVASVDGGATGVGVGAVEG